MDVNITDLAEEIILKILKYLSVKDLICISTTNSLFNRLACDKELVSELNFNKAYSCTTEDLKTFLVPRTRCINIRSLDLSNCYWIKAPLLIVKLKNLESLQMNSVQLTFIQLEAILKACPKLRDLCISWPDESIPLKQWLEMLVKVEEDKNVLSNLQSLRAMVNCKFSHFMVFLSQCNSLRRLIITSHHYRNCGISSTDYGAYQAFCTVSLPHLQEVIVDQDDLMFPIPFLTDVIHGPDQEQKKTHLDWKVCWLNNNRVANANMRLINHDILTSCSRLLYSFSIGAMENIKRVGELSNVKELMVVGGAPFNTSLTSVVSACPNLRSLNVLFGLNITLDIAKLFTMLPDLERLSLQCQPEQGPTKIVSGVAKFHNLTHLSVPVCALIEVRNQAKVIDGQKNYFVSKIGLKRRRVGYSVDLSSAEAAAFNEVYENCPKIVMLQIGFHEGPSCSPSKVHWECLANIQKLKKLTHLTLDGIPITSGHFLIEIAKGCSQLQFLRLRRLGPSGKCVYVAHLAEALPFCQNLINFRVEQNYLAPGSNIFKALEECGKLERFAFLSERDMTSANTEAIEHLIKTRTSLVFVFIVAGQTTKVKCANLTKKFKKVKSRPALIVRVKNILRDVFYDNNKDNYSTPACHYNEMITFRSWMYEFYDKD